MSLYLVIILVIISVLFVLNFYFVAEFRVGAFSLYPVALGTLIYLGIAFLLKIWIIVLSGNEFLIQMSLPTTQDKSNLAYSVEMSFIYIFAVAIAMHAALFFVKLINKAGVRRRKIDWFTSAKFKTVFVLLLIAKFLTNYYLSWNVPAERPIGVVPVVTGLFVFLARDGVVVFGLILIYEIFTYKNNKIQNSLIIITSLIVDMYFGSKYIFTCYAIGIALMYVYTRRSIAVGLSGMLLSFLVFMPLFSMVNVFRFLKLDDTIDLQNLILLAIDKVDFSFTFLVGAVLSRISGIESIFNIRNSNIGFELGLTDFIVGGQFMSDYVYAITGLDSTEMGLGSTLAGISLIYSKNNILVYFFTAVTLSFLVMCMWLVFEKLLRKSSSSIMFSYGVYAAIVSVHIQMSSGNISFFVKQLFVVFMIYLMLLYLRKQFFSS